MHPRFDSTYGPVGISPLEKERQLFPSDYLRLMASGALAGVVRTDHSRDGPSFSQQVLLSGVGRCPLLGDVCCITDEPRFYDKCGWKHKFEHA